MRHTDWDELEAPVRLAIEARTGRVRAVRTVNAGLNSQLAVVLDTDAGWVFVKGLRVDHPGVVRRLYDEISRQDPQPFKQCLASVADSWVRHRRAWPRS